jgi:hypothetical protein
MGGAIAAASCRPDFAERESRVDRVQVLAIRVEPPEARPGEVVTTSLLVASPDGPVDAPTTSWAFCATPKLLTENGAVSAACQAEGVVPIAEARGGVSAPLPARACFDFGPETQSADVRPRAPDVTGGYYSPIRARFADAGGAPLTAFGFARVRCNLADASADLAARFLALYVPNASPSLLPIEAHLDGGGAPISLDAVPRGARVVLRASWRPEDAELYVVFDPAQQVIVERRESLRVSWFATAGTFENDRTGRGADEPESWTENAWTAPDDARATHLWLVLRDARGGVAFSSAVASTR